MQDLVQLEPLAKDVPQTKRGHERCLALLISVTELFLEHGYDAVSLDDIVNHAGGSKASIYKYFGNRSLAKVVIANSSGLPVQRLS